jgi:hypothetical protein
MNSTELRLFEKFRRHNGFRAEGPPCVYEVKGMPRGLERRIEWDGSPEGRWRIWRAERKYAIDQDHEHTFATPNEALEALRQEVE